jgi:LL-diaminopimelate aminotransferase
MTVPGYPVAGTWTRYLGGEVYKLPLKAEIGFYPDLDGIPADIKKRAKLLVINYPNSPTGVVATTEFYKRVVEFAHQHQIVIVQDAAHILLTYWGEPLSFLEVDGAKEVGVEVHSMSKGYNMIGWRLGFVCGNAKIVQAYADVKDNSDSGQFMAIQHAAAQALRTPSIPERVRAKYRRRLEKLVAALKQVGFACSMPGGTYFLYTAAPRGAGDRSFANAEEASQYLIHEQSISCVPWDDAGAYLRFSVTYSAKDSGEEDALMAETVARLKGMKLRF